MINMLKALLFDTRDDTDAPCFMCNSVGENDNVVCGDCGMPLCGDHAPRTLHLCRSNS